ncbi:MAG: DUF3750 domain-containing protein [Pseudomonadota bacterium]
MRTTRRLVTLFLLFFLLPVLASTIWWANVDRPASWRNADWGPSGVLPAASAVPEATVHVMAARTGGWKGAVSVHSWILVKPAGATAWTRYDVVGWGEPVRRDAYAPDARWYSNTPFVVGTVSGAQAADLIPRIEAVVADYPWSDRGAYRIWPGPNSNSFVAHILREVPEIGVALPPLAVGKDWLGDGVQTRWDDGGDLHVSAWGLAGLSLGPRSGFELHLLGTSAGLDLLRPALKLPGVGRIGLTRAPATTPTT